MKAIVALTHLEHDCQLDHVERLVKKEGIWMFRICTNANYDQNFALQTKGSKTTIFFEGKPLVIKVVWYASHPRTDAMYCRGFRFPGEHRSAMLQFVLDLHYSYQSTVAWFPCNINLIEQADSKPFLLREANLAGLKTPPVTLNATLLTKQGVLAGKLYKKKLGFPSIVTFDKKSGYEVVTTTENKLGDSNAGREIWQWQTPVESYAHVRCCIVEKKIWAVVWNRESSIGRLYDYRTQKKAEKWEAYVLPARIKMSLMKLADRLDLKIACPEFLIDKEGQHIFIDMNPCGDWAGFFEESASDDIATSIAKMLTSSFK